MKRFLSLTIVLLATIISFAQTQQGIVKTRGRLNSNGTVTHGKGISGATVTLGNGSTQVSGNNGTFSFAVSKETYSLKNVQKQNYQLCDRDLLGRNKKYSTDTLAIAMQTPDEALEDRLESEEKIRATLIAELNKQKAELRRLKEEQRITQQEYNEKLKALYDAQSTNEKFISEMAERYSTMDFDQMDEFQSRVAFYIRNGELTRADSLLNTKGSMIERSAELDRMDAAIKADSEDIAQRQIAHNAAVEHKAKKLEDFAVDCYSRYEMCLMKYQNDSAAYWLELRASKDSLNIAWQMEAGLFISNYLADYEKAMKYYQLVLTNSLNIFGEEHPDVAISYNNIGDIYDSQGEYAYALEYYTKALDIWKNIFGEEHPAVATIYNNIGSVYDSHGDYSRALEYHTKALGIRKKIFGEVHSDVAASYNNIGSIYYSQGDYAHALEYLTKALNIQKKIYGEEHSDVAASYNNIGMVYADQGEYAHALEYLTKALNIQKKIFGEEHPDVAGSYNNIGSVYHSQGDDSSTLEYLTKSLEINKKIFGEEHPDVALSYNNIGSVYADQGEYAYALEYYTKALDIWKKIFGEEHPDVATSYNNIGSVYDSQGDYSRALEYHTKALGIRKKIFGEEHPDVAASYNNIGSIYYSQGDYSHALEYLTKALNIQKKIYGEEHSDVAASYVIIGLIYCSQGDYSRALECYTKALGIWKKVFGEEHPNVVIYYDIIGDIYLFKGDFFNAMENYTKALEIRRKVLGERHPDYEDAFISTHQLYDMVQNKNVYSQEFETMIATMIYTLTCIDGDTPARKQGMSGEYFVLEFAGWTIQSNTSLINKNEELRGKPKTVVVMKDGVISEHSFENSIGAQIKCKYVGKEEKQRIVEAYEQWEKIRSAEK